MEAILLVTWITSGQPPSSYQTQFTTMEACQAARAAVLQEASRSISEWQRNMAPNPVQPPGTYIPSNMVPYRPRYTREQIATVMGDPTGSPELKRKMLETYQQQDNPVEVPYKGGTVYVDPRSGQQWFLGPTPTTPSSASAVCVSQ
jgi:hypothetical protein